jgi:hypothetical protein
MSTSVQELRALIDEASEGAVVVKEVELELRDRKVAVQLVTPDLLTIQDVLEEARSDAVEGEPAKDFNGRYMRKLVAKIAYAAFDAERMDGELIFPRGEIDPIYRRLTRHPTAFAALTVAAAEVVRPLQAIANGDSPPLERGAAGGAPMGASAGDASTRFS